MIDFLIFGKSRYDGLEYHLCEELRKRGLNVVIMYYPTIISEKADDLLRDKVEVISNLVIRRVLLQVQKYKPRVFLTTLRNIHPDIISQLKKRDVLTVNINPDHLVNFHAQQIFAEEFDYYFTKDPYIARFMRGLNNLNVFEYQEAGSLTLADRAEIQTTFNRDVLAFGNLYPYRQRFLTELSLKGVHLEIYGKPSRFGDLRDLKIGGGPIFGTDKIELIRTSKIVLNNLHYAEIESVNNKFFEINLYGGFQICDYRPIIDDLLPFDASLVTYKDIDSAKERIEYFLQNEEEREELRQIVTEHFKKNHTYKSLVDYLLSIVGTF